MSNWKDLQRTIKKEKPKQRVKLSTTHKPVSSMRNAMKATPLANGKAPILKTSKTFQAALIDVPSMPQLGEYQVNTCKTLAGTLANDDTSLFYVGPVPEYTPHKKASGTFVAMDCEFVGTGFKGSVSELARVSIVNYYGYTLLDLYVRPQNYVTDWRTKYSGITPSLVKNGVTFKDAQKQVSDLIHGKVLVGHGLTNDMKVLLLSHPQTSTIDTQILARYKESPEIRGRPGLKRLCQSYLGLQVQKGSHDSVEDSRGAMLLFRLFKQEYLRQHRVKLKRVTKS